MAKNQRLVHLITKIAVIGLLVVGLKKVPQPHSLICFRCNRVQDIRSLKIKDNRNAMMTTSFKNSRKSFTSISQAVAILLLLALKDSQ